MSDNFAAEEDWIMLKTIGVGTEVFHKMIEEQENWFRNTEIFADREFCNEFMGRFPVIFLTLKSIAFNNFNDSYSELARVISSLALNFSYLKSSPELDNDELKIFYKLLDLDFLKDPANKSLAKAAHFGYYREMINVVGQLLATGLKGNTNMKKAVLTGCLRAAKESIFTGLNNFQNCTILNSGNDRLSAGFGFTEEETNAMLSMPCFPTTGFRIMQKK